LGGAVGVFEGVINLTLSDQLLCNQSPAVINPSEKVIPKVQSAQKISISSSL
jgi:hypothetical protein